MFEFWFHTAFITCSKLVSFHSVQWMWACSDIAQRPPSSRELLTWLQGPPWAQPSTESTVWPLLYCKRPIPFSSIYHNLRNRFLKLLISTILWDLAALNKSLNFPTSGFPAPILEGMDSHLMSTLCSVLLWTSPYLTFTNALGGRYSPQFHRQGNWKSESK